MIDLDRENKLQVIWHELGHVFVAIYAGAELTYVRFYKLGEPNNKFRCEGLTFFNDFVKNDEILDFENLRFFVLRIFNIFSGSIFEGYYLNDDSFELFEEGKKVERSDYMKFEKYISDFKNKYNKNIKNDCLDMFEKIEQCFRQPRYNGFDYSLMLNELVGKILLEWSSNEKCCELSKGLIDEIKRSIMSLINSDFKNDMENLICELINKIR